MASAATKLAPEQSTGNASDLVMSARVEFYACLQLLAERARFVTGASWAAIAVREGEQFTYRAASGPDAPRIGNEAKIKPDAELEFQASKSLVVPVMRDSRNDGFFQLSSDGLGFSDQNFKSVLRLSTVVGTALDHLDAAEHSQELIFAKTKQSPKVEIPLFWHAPEGLERSSSQSSNAIDGVFDSGVHTCESCGFPVSDGRSICVDCESRIGMAPPSSGIFAPQKSESWIRAHGYTIASLLLPAVAAAIIYWLR